MKTRLIRMAVVSAIGFACLAQAPGWAAEEFSAEVVNIAQDQRFEGKVFVGAEKMRMETPEAITITRMDQKKIWVLMPQQRMYLEQSFSTASLVGTSDKLPGETERTLIGEETIGGRAAKKFRIGYRQDAKEETVFQWYVPDFSIPVKIAAGDGSWVMEYRNIRMGKQPESLFEVPAGYKKFSSDFSSLQDMAQGLE
ncbi:MAG: hypothetical protein PHR11_03440 [Candidatus Omnitrophica bacterium]|nr:hypothetical protein [Candidatus Omnitrophota bacterium]